MISPLDGMPLVKLDDGEVVAFERVWLIRALVEAAARAGYQKWWLAEHVSESVTDFLALQWEENVVTIPRLELTIRSALEVIGYPEVAPHLALGIPGVRLSLVSLLYEAGSGYELFFFDRLGQRMTELMERGVTYIEIDDVVPCVKLLCSRKSWARDCEVMRGEIVGFIRAHVETEALSGQEMSLRIS